MLIIVNMKDRSYVMKARAEAVQETHQRILRAGAEFMWEKASPDITLDDVAERSGITVQTILRHFGTRERLLAAVESFLQQQLVAERSAPAGDVAAAVKAIFDHYELRGDVVLRLLGQEFWNERIRAGMDTGRRIHREWVEQVFGPQLAEHPAEERPSVTDLLVVATDVYTWKLLRRDRLLDRAQAEERVKRLIAAILADMKGN
jgi:AcrR family transcriptional regulator